MPNQQRQSTEGSYIMTDKIPIRRLSRQTLSILQIQNLMDIQTYPNVYSNWTFVVLEGLHASHTAVHH